MGHKDDIFGQRERGNMFRMFSVIETYCCEYSERKNMSERNVE